MLMLEMNSAFGEAVPPILAHLASAALQMLLHDCILHNFVEDGSGLVEIAYRIQGTPCAAFLEQYCFKAIYQMAELVGLNGIHSLEGFLCDLCGGPCDPQAHELNALDCTFSNCSPESAVYHQDCLEKYLKGIRLEKYALLII